MPWNKEIEQERRCRLIRQKQAADELGGDDLSGAGEEGRGEVLGERGGYGSDQGMRSKKHPNRINCKSIP